MAQKSRFRTTSGPTANRSEKFKKKSSRDKKDSSEGNDFKKKGFAKSPFKSFGGKGKPFIKKDFRDKDSSPRSFDPPKGPREFSDRKLPFKAFGDKGKPFVKKDFRDKESGPRSFDRDKKPGDGAERTPKSFSREGQGNRPPRKDSPQFSDRNRSYGSSGKDFSKKKFDENAPGAVGKKPFNDSKRPRKVQTTEVEETLLGGGDDLIRLNRFISNSGICSRREADEMIKVGLITVNGKSVTELGFKVKRTDDVRHDGKRLKAEKPVYLLLNKPKGFITTTDDPQERNTVMHLISGACKERVYPVGRLDRNTSGLLLLTNDGELTEKLSHPKHNVKKIYRAELDKPLTKNDFQKIVDGVRLEEGKAMVDDIALIGDDGKIVGLEIHIGWNRVIRRIFETLGYEVMKLDRSVYATLDKKDLPRGHWRFLRQDEVIRLKHFQ
jgi:23S rRNA pseudouridine2605 synthase